MTEFLFVILTVVYAVVAIKVDQWSTISYLGFKTETPQLFLSNPSLYHRTRILLFSATVVSGRCRSSRGLAWRLLDRPKSRALRFSTHSSGDDRV